jgi:predicted xylanase/chitin deacetylase
VSILLLVFGVSFVAAYPVEEKIEQVNNAVYNGKTDCGKIALTFNVYERADNVAKIAEILDEYGFKSTFFVGGCWAAKNGDTLLRLASSSHEIGNHGYSHLDHAKLSRKRNEEEIRITEKVIDSSLSSLPDYANSKLFAPPSGSMSNAMFDACKELGYTVIMWTRDTIDWRDHNPDLIFERATKNLKAGDIILMHPTDATVAALPRILEYIKSQNLVADTVSNVIEK